MTHDPMCPNRNYEEWQPCVPCEMISRVREDERKKYETYSNARKVGYTQGYEAAQREAQEAVAKIPLDSFWDGGKQAALLFNDGWRTGYDAAINTVGRDAK